MWECTCCGHRPWHPPSSHTHRVAYIWTEHEGRRGRCGCECPCDVRTSKAHMRFTKDSWIPISKNIHIKLNQTMFLYLCKSFKFNNLNSIMWIDLFNSYIIWFPDMRQVHLELQLGALTIFGSDSRWSKMVLASCAGSKQLMVNHVLMNIYTYTDI